VLEGLDRSCVGGLGPAARAFSGFDVTWQTGRLGSLLVGGLLLDAVAAARTRPSPFRSAEAGAKPPRQRRAQPVDDRTKRAPVKSAIP